MRAWSIRLVRLVAIFTLLLAPNSYAAKPRVIKIDQVCTGDPCVVRDKFAVPDGTTFDLGSDLGDRALELNSGSSLEGDSGASFSIIHARTITVQKGAVINTIGRGGNAGSLTLQSTGACLIFGKIVASTARIAGIGGNGGAISLTCTGIDLGGTGLIEANGAGGTGGQITLAAGTAPVSSLKGSKLTATGAGGNGGSLSVSSSADCTLGASMLLNASKSNNVGGRGGYATILCTGITLGDGASIEACAGGDNGDWSTIGGQIQLDAQTGAVVINKAVKLKANGSAADGGTIEIASQSSCTLSGKMTASSIGVGFDSGDGGTVDISCTESILIDRGGVEASGSAPFGLGGEITLTAGGVPGTIELVKNVVLKAPGVGAPGGRVTLDSAGDCDISAKLQVDGKPVMDSGFSVGDIGGDAVLTCDGTLSLHEGAAISANGSSQMVGGNILLSAGAAGITTEKGIGAAANAKDGLGGVVSFDSDGPCRVEGKFEARGTGSGSGGSVVAGCAGPITLTKNATVDASGNKAGTSGTILINATAGAIQIDKGAQVHSHGVGQVGINAIEIDATGTCTVGGKVDSNSEGAAGAAIQMTCAGVTLESSAGLEAGGKAASAGQFTIDATGATTNRPPAACDIRGKIKVNAASKTDSSVTPSVVTPGTGGAVAVKCGSVSLASTATIGAIGSGTGSAGGTIALTAIAGTAMVAGDLSAKGVGTGGTIRVVGLGVTQTSASSAEVTGFTAGTIDLFSGTIDPVSAQRTVADGVTVSTTLNAKGAGSGTNHGGAILIEGCSVTVDAAATLKADGKIGGTNTLSGHSQLTVSGKVTALAGQNLFRYGDQQHIDMSNVKPATIPEHSLSPC